MDNQNARRCFYKGQSVKAEHLNKLQDYSDRGQANLIASLLGYGVVNGFEISIIEGHIVGVTAGLAFNLTGERLVLAEGQQVNLAQYIPNVGEKTIKLGIIQDFIKTDPATDSMGNTEYTKWIPSVQFVLGESLDTGVFLLAEIKINPVSIVEIKATSANFTTLQKQIQNTFAFSTDRSSESIVANIDADIFNINNKSFADTIKDLIYPINYQYTQYPNEATGVFDETATPLALFGGTWEKLFTSESVFFRTQKSTSDTDRVNGVQLDAMQKMTGNISSSQDGGYYNDIFSSGSGVFKKVSGIPNISKGLAKDPLYDKPAFNIAFDNSLQVRTSTENRPINMLMIIWKRIG